jgi:hypothetical protein
MNVATSIVAEVRATREALAKESDDDLEKIVEAARARQLNGDRKAVSLPPRKTGLARRVS